MTKEQKRIAALEKALAPFAAEASMWADAVPDSYRPGLTERGQKVATGKARFTLGNLRRAAKLLAEKL